MKRIVIALALIVGLSGCTASKESTLTPPNPSGTVHRIPPRHKETHEKLLKSQSKLILSDYGWKICETD